MPTAAGTARGLRDRPLGKVAILAAVLLAAFLVSRSCGATDPNLTKDEAIEIAKRQVDYEPKCVFVRLTKRGFQSREFWAVSLSRPVSPSASRVTIVQLNADTGAVDQVKERQDRRVEC